VSRSIQSGTNAPRRALDQTFDIQTIIGKVRLNSRRLAEAHPQAPIYEWLRRVLELNLVVHIGRINYRMYSRHFSVYPVSLDLTSFGRWQY
jgi:hypothetical protein